jgi:hypothetical protein
MGIPESVTATSKYIKGEIIDEKPLLLLWPWYMY